MQTYLIQKEIKNISVMDVRAGKPRYLRLRQEPHLCIRSSTSDRHIFHMTTLVLPPRPPCDQAKLGNIFCVRLESSCGRTSFTARVQGGGEGHGDVVRSEASDCVNLNVC